MIFLIILIVAVVLLITFCETHRLIHFWCRGSFEKFRKIFQNGEVVEIRKESVDVEAGLKVEPPKNTRNVSTMSTPE